MAQVKRNVYRKAALDRLSSPDQLDRMITIVPAGLWMALAGGAIAVVLTILWSIVGRIPVTVQTNGIFMTGSGVQTIYAGNGGIIDTVNYRDGDFIEKDAVIAVYRNEEIQIKIDNLNDRKKLVEAVTIDSKGDIGSEDNKPMLDLKSQLLTVGNNYGANEALLEAKMAELGAQKAKTDAARDNMAAARDRYYASLNEGSNTAAQLKMQDALNDVNNARQDLQNAKSDYNNAYSYLAQAQNALTSAQAQNDSFIATYAEQLEQLKSQKKNAEETRAFAYHELYQAVRGADEEYLNDASDKGTTGRWVTDPYYGSHAGSSGFSYTPSAEYNDGFMIWGGTIDPDKKPNDYSVYSQMKNTYLQSTNQIDELNSKIKQLDDQKNDYAKKVADAQKKVDEELAKLGQSADINGEKAKINDAISRYYSAEEVYLAGEQAQLQKHAASGVASAEYNFALDAYRTELSSQRSLDDALVELQSRTLSEKANRDSQSDMIIYQFENAKAAALANLDKELEQQYEAMRNSEIRSSCDGVITDLRIEEGSAVQGGAAVANVTNFITTQDTPANVIESFVPAAEGKKIREGMTVKVYPSTANRNEYGHMEGRVLEVDDYITSREDMINELGDTTLVDSFLRNGPVIKVTTTLQADPTTASGYFWSNQKGRDLTLETGTIVTTDTILERKAPITMLIPYLKDKFDSMSQKEVKDQQNGGQTGGEVNGGQQQ